MLGRYAWLLCAALSLTLLTAPALAGLNVGFMDEETLSPTIAPGSCYTQTFLVKIDDGDTPVDVTVGVKGWGQTAEGAITALAPEEDTYAYSGRSYFQPGSTTVHVTPGESTRVDFTITVPRETGAGGRYAIISFCTDSDMTGQVKIESELLFPIKMTIQGSGLIHTGEITGIDTGDAVNGQPIVINTIFRNTGNHHFGVKNIVEIRDAAGSLLDTIVVNASSPVPEQVKRLKAAFAPQAGLPAGTYAVASRVIADDGRLLDEAEGIIELRDPYTPPFPPVSITLNPSSSAVLRAEGDRVVVDFPKGSVLSTTLVSMKCCPLSQVSDLPEGCNLPPSGFQISGLQGLLAQPAIITVGYTDEDLVLADGDATHLVLARWDEVQDMWTALPTSVDSGGKTLTATTDRLGIWTVMGASGTVLASAQGRQFAPTAAIVSVVGLCIIFLLRRRR